MGETRLGFNVLCPVSPLVSSEAAVPQWHRLFLRIKSLIETAEVYVLYVQCFDIVLILYMQMW